MEGTTITTRSQFKLAVEQSWRAMTSVAADRKSGTRLQAKMEGQYRRIPGLANPETSSCLPISGAQRCLSFTPLLLKTTLWPENEHIIPPGSLGYTLVSDSCLAALQQLSNDPRPCTMPSQLSSNLRMPLVVCKKTKLQRRQSRQEA